MIPTLIIVQILNIVLLIFFNSYWLSMLMMMVFVVIVCIYIVYDVNLITSKHGLSEDEYIIGALILYIDLMSLLKHLMLILGGK